MGKERQKVTITDDPGILVKELFKEKVPEEFLVRLNKHEIDHYHSYGGVSHFFRGLTKGKLLGTFCFNCFSGDPKIGIWLPPYAGCPDCWNEHMAWLELSAKGAEVYTYSIADYSGAGAKGSLPWPLISVEIPGVWTKIMSYMSEFGEGEPYIGIPIKPVFRTENPTYTILDLSWVPDDERIEMQKRKQKEKEEEKERRKQLECFRCT